MIRLVFLIVCIAASAVTAHAQLATPQLARPTTEAAAGDALHEKYDAAWFRYEQAIGEVRDKVNAALDAQFEKAADAGNLDLADMWDEKKKVFADTGSVAWPSDGKTKTEWRKKHPTEDFPDDFTDVITTAQAGFAKAVATLKEDYESLVKDYTKGRNLARAKGLRDELAGLASKPVTPAEPPSIVEKKGEKEATNLRSGSRSIEKGSSAKRIVRVRYHFAANGSCKIETVRLKADATPVPDGYKKEDLGNGIWRITETFEDENSVQRFVGQLSEVMNVSFSAEEKALAFSPKGGGEPKAVLPYPKRCRLPLTVEADISTAEQHGHLQISPNAAMPPNIHPFLNVLTHDGGSTLDVSCSWVVSRDSKTGQPTIEEQISERGILTSKLFSREARPPVATDSEMMYFVNMGVFGAGPDSSKLYLRRLSVTARFAPLLGVSINQKNAGEPLVVAAVAKNSPAEEAGLKVGDVVTTVDGKAPNTLVRAIQLFSMTNYGEFWNIDVERDGESKTFVIKAE